MNLGVPEILLILVVALLFFGPSRLPGLGKSIGEAIRGFKKGMHDDADEVETQARTNEPKTQLDSNSQKQTSYQTETEKQKDTDKNKV